MLVGWVIRVLVVALILRVVVSFIRGLASGVSRSRSAATGESRKSVPLVKDPVCGTYVEPSHAVSVRTGSTLHYFCSETCRQTFRKWCLVYVSATDL